MKENPRLEEAENRKAKGSLLGMFLGASNKGPEEQGKGFVSKFECWGCGAAEAAAELSRTQKKQHVGI